MAIPEQSKEQEIKSIYQGYCKQHLDDEYLALCDQLYEDLLEFDADVFQRGRINIWASAIVWAVGSINFLGDKSFEPYASLKDVCSYFGANTSTVGQKAALIREWLDIDQFTEEYIRSDSSLLEMLNSMVITESGLIVPRDMLEGVEEDDFEDELPGNYIVVLEVTRKMKQADLYQIEYLFKSVLDEDEYVKKIYLKDSWTVLLHYYGKPHRVRLFERKDQRMGLAVLDVVDDDQSNNRDKASL